MHVCMYVCMYVRRAIRLRVHMNSCMMSIYALGTLHAHRWLTSGSADDVVASLPEPLSLYQVLKLRGEYDCVYVETM